MQFLTPEMYCEQCSFHHWVYTRPFTFGEISSRVLYCCMWWHFLVMHLGEGPSNAAPSLKLQNLQSMQLMFFAFLSKYKIGFLNVFVPKPTLLELWSTFLTHKMDSSTAYGSSCAIMECPLQTSPTKILYSHQDHQVPFVAFDPSWVVQIRPQINPRRRTAAILKIKNRYISTKDWPIVTKFNTVMHLNPSDPVIQ